MEDQKKIAEAEAQKVMDWYRDECKKIAKKYKNTFGMDNGIIEEKELTRQAYEKIQAIKRNYNVPLSSSTR